MKSRLEWKVGLFVFIGLVLMGGLLLQFSKGTTFFRPTYTLLLHSPDVAGLKVRAAVLMSGVQVGTVSAIDLAPDGKSVTIRLKIYSSFVIYRDAKFVIEQSGFLGDQYVAISPTKNEGGVFADHNSAEAEPPFNIQEVARTATGLAARVDETARSLNEAIADLRRLLLTEHTLTNLSATVVNARLMSEKGLTTLDDVKALVESNKPSITISLSNLLLFSEAINRVGAGLGELVATNSEDVHMTLTNLEAASAKLRSFMENVDQGQGLAGTLVRNPQVASNMADIVSNLSITTSNLNRLGLWGILWKKKAPKVTGEDASPPNLLRSPKGGT